MERILFQHVDVPDINRLSVHMAHGGYDTLKKAVTEMQPSEVTKAVSDSGLAGRGGPPSRLDASGASFPREYSPPTW